MKYLDLSSNKFNELAAFKCPKLEYLDISYNKIEKVNEKKRIIEEKRKSKLELRNEARKKLRELYNQSENRKVGWTKQHRRQA